MNKQNDDVLMELLRKEGSGTPTKRIPKEGDPPHPRGIIEEHYADGSKRFTGSGGGVLWILASGEAEVMPVGKILPQRLRLLIEVRRSMSESPLKIGDVAEYKEEARMMLEALRKGEAQFFRDIADSLNLAPSKVKSRAASEKKAAEKVDEVLQSIANAAARVETKPAFHAVIKEFRTYPDHAKEVESDFRKKLKHPDRGFGWLC